MIQKRSNSKFLLGIAVAFLLPLSFYLIAKALKKDKIYMPAYFIADRVDSQVVDGKVQYDSIFHKVADIQLTNQLAEKVSLNKDLAGKVLVINFFFTTCPDVCPKITSNLFLLQRAFRKDPKKEFKIGNEIQLISITVNPSADSVPALRAYAEKYGANHDHWWFLTGDKRDIYNYARNELHVSVQPGDGGPEDFIHSRKIIVVDQERYIRGYYNGLDSIELKKCADDIVLLTLEKKKKRN
jgi:protein SCO1/2